MRIARPVTFFVIFWLIMSLYAAYDNRDEFDLLTWGKGFLGMLLIPSAWYANRRIGTFLSTTGIVFFILTVVGVFLFQTSNINHVFFNGCTLGFMAGFVVAYFVHRPRSYEVALFIAASENYPKLVQYFEQKIENTNR